MKFKDNKAYGYKTYPELGEYRIIAYRILNINHNMCKVIEVGNAFNEADLPIAILYATEKEATIAAYEHMLNDAQELVEEFKERIERLKKN
jgi:hypothetical protein